MEMHMNEINYAKIRAWFLAKEYRLTIFLLLYKGLPVLVFISYAVLCSLLLVLGDSRIYKVILIPMFIFISVSIMRKIINKPRPYVVLNIDPLVKKDKNGESFPRRHVLSVSIIAVACFWIQPLLGFVMSILVILIAIIRVLSGVHFIKDVIWGALISYIVGGLLFWLL
jgi:membrane-associated phospholipid phosphatase